MKIFKVVLLNCLLLLSVSVFTHSVTATKSTAKLQAGNTIAGYVFGVKRQAVSNVDVELTDDFSRTVARVQTNSSGRYEFNRLSAGKYRVKVLPYATNYEEQIQEVEIINFSRQSSTGTISRGGFENSQCDFYLKLKKGSVSPETNAVVFIQEVPKEAKLKYDAAVAKIKSKNNTEALSELKSAIELFPDYFDALDLLGNEYVTLKYYEAGQILLSKAITINPKSYRTSYGLAYAYYSLNQTDKAVEAIVNAININSRAVDAIVLYAILLKQNKKYDESLKQLKGAKEIANNSSPEINWQLALLYANNFKQYDKAAEELQTYLKQQPNSDNNESIKKLIKTFKEKAGNK